MTELPTVYLLQPPPGRLKVSGGYRYNARIGRRLQETGRGRVLEIPADELGTQLARLAAGDPTAVFVLDSLYIPAIAEPQDLGLADLDSRLLLHYRPSLEPGLTAEQAEVLARHEDAWLTAVHGVITVSPEHGAELATHFEGRSLVVASPGVDECFQAGTLRPPTDGSVRIVSVGNLIPTKGQLELVQAIAALPEDLRTRVELTLIGDLELDPEYVTAVRQTGTSLHLTLTGRLESTEVARELQRSHLYVSASRWELYPMAVAEALASGLPVLAYAVGEVPCWIGNGHGGVLLDPEQEQALPQELARLLADPTLLEPLRGQRSRASFPTWDATWHRFLESCHHPRRLPSTKVELYATCDLPTEYGTFKVQVYRCPENRESILLSQGDLASEEPPFVRIHSECLTGEVLHSLKCDCGHQLEYAQQKIGERGHGAIVYLRQEGRGIGLGNKIRAYAEQEKGADTVDANLVLGFPPDLRDFSIAARILQENGVRRVHLHTNNPQKVESLRQNGIQVDVVETAVSPLNPHNLSYLRTKLHRLGHVGLEESLGGAPEPAPEPPVVDPGRA